jgi:hypothetical protein
MMKLGKYQKIVLDNLQNVLGYWHPGCGWKIKNDKQTIRIMKTLEQKGLVIQRLDGIQKNKFMLIPKGKQL